MERNDHREAAKSAKKMQNILPKKLHRLRALRCFAVKIFPAFAWRC